MIYDSYFIDYFIQFLDIKSLFILRSVASIYEKAVKKTNIYVDMKKCSNVTSRGLKQVINYCICNDLHCIYRHILISFHKYSYVNFRNACRLGSLGILMRMYAYDEFRDIDIHKNGEECFVMLCLSGHLSAAKWFVDTCDRLGSKIDIDSFPVGEKERVKYIILRHACITDDIDLLLYIYHLSFKSNKPIDIKRNKYMYFAISKDRVMTWLVSTVAAGQMF